MVHKYLIILSAEFCVWDMVTSETVHGTIFKPIHTLLTSSDKKATTHLAVNYHDNTLGIAVPYLKDGELWSRVAIFSPEDPEPLCSQRLPKLITSLVSAAGKRGYYCIDSSAEMRTLMPGQILPDITEATVEDQEDKAKSGLTNIYGNGTNVLQLKNIKLKSQGTDEEMNLVSHERLAELFEAKGSGNAMPMVGEMYEQVAKLFIGKSDG